MTSKARIEANGRNAKKSSGPKTEAGKERSRANSVRHGMTARVVLLPDENRTEFVRKMKDFVTSLTPRNEIEMVLAERACYLSWQLARATRAESARLCVKVHTVAAEERSRVEREVFALGQRLLRRPGGRPAVAAYLCVEREEGQTGNAWPASGDTGENSAEVIGELESSGAGCRWLLERWSELESMLENQLAWKGPDRFRAFRLLRINAMDATFTPELTSLLRACQVVDPGSGSLAAELWSELVPAKGLRALEEILAAQIEQSGPMDHAAARGHLLDVVKREKERIEARLEQHEERAEIEDLTEKHRMAFDDGKEAELLRRYMATNDKYFYRAIDELTKRQHYKAQGYNSIHNFLRAVDGWLAPESAQSGCSEVTEESEWVDSSDIPDDDGEPVGVEESDVLPEQTPLRNEPNSVLTVDGVNHGELAGSELPLRNEPNSVLQDGLNKHAESIATKRPNKVVAAAREILANQGHSPVVVGPHSSSGSDHVATGSRRGRRRAQREMKRRSTEPAPTVLGQSILFRSGNVLSVKGLRRES